jgi:hypothetical protein
MGDNEHEREDPREREEPLEDELLEPQERKGYGEDEGEREESLPGE